MSDPRTEFEDAVRATFPMLDRWSLRARSPYVPDSESALAEDDTDWPWLATSHLAVSSMASATDHLQAVRAQVENGDFYAFAQASLLRTSTLSAAQAVWILYPDDRADRLQNARILAAEMYKQHLFFLNDAQRLSDQTHEGTEQVRERVSQRCHELADKRAAAGQKATWSATTAIEQASRWSFDGEENVDVQGRYWWRLGSGAAHGLQWSLLGQPQTSQTGNPDLNGVATFTTEPSVDALALPYNFALELLRHAWHLLDKRGTRPQPPTGDTQP